ncbi:MAG TPA: DUF3303 family protein [Nocardioidaceae bacterium]|nr:DUF3303 family protein [Nocardioidaceae bacterium]
MKYVITWTARPNVTEESQARGLQVFGKWVPSSDVTFEQFLGRVDQQGGYAVVTTDNPQAIARDMAIFGTWFEMTVVPVLEIADATVQAADALEFMASVS